MPHTFEKIQKAEDLVDLTTTGILDPEDAC
jgi:hypothetical protein